MTPLHALLALAIAIAVPAIIVLLLWAKSSIDRNVGAQEQSIRLGGMIFNETMANSRAEFRNTMISNFKKGGWSQQKIDDWLWKEERRDKGKYHPIIKFFAFNNLVIVYEIDESDLSLAPSIEDKLRQILTAKPDIKLRDYAHELGIHIERIERDSNNPTNVKGFSAGARKKSIYVGDDDEPIS